MDSITETTQITFSLSQFITILSFVITQTAFIIGVYWKLNKKIDKIDSKVNLNQSLNNNQYIGVETALTTQEKSFQNKCTSMERESDLRFKSFDNTLQITNDTLCELSTTVKELSKLVTEVREEFIEHKGYQMGKESLKQ